MHHLEPERRGAEEPEDEGKGTDEATTEAELGERDAAKTEKAGSGRERGLGVLVDAIRTEDVVKEASATVCKEGGCITAERCQYAHPNRANRNNSKVPIVVISTYMLLLHTTSSLSL